MRFFSPPAGIEENDPLLFNSPSSDEMIGSIDTVVLFFFKNGEKMTTNDDHCSLVLPPEMRIQCDAR